MEECRLNQERRKNEDSENTVSLKEFITEKFISLEKLIELSREANEKRLEGLNGIQRILQDQNNNFLTRKEYEPKHEILNNKITEIQSKIAELMPRKEFELKIGPIQRLVYIGLGAVAALDIILKFSNFKF